MTKKEMRVWLYHNIQQAYSHKKIFRQQIQQCQCDLEEYTKLLKDLKQGKEIEVSERIEEICRKAVVYL